ncbi:replication initiator protein [Blackfly microvirus SF02]|uniref:Replication initiator protein n=1 Tax=Blackfly microvirus SF02 TaxID=2576452 RepID=A0A4P8PKX1_9VIRU|nr:replication initiator protein [Blackfly microvirus SF02]
MCINPISLKGPERTVPCGKCMECRKRKVSGWSFRLMQEDKISTSSHFITLTYDTNKVPITNKGYMSLEKRDLQLFFKRLRKSHIKNSGTIKYYAVGEYGGKTWRPHYHIILFNADIKLIQSAWNNGQVHYGNITEASVGYTLKYISKPGKIPQHKKDDRQKEFTLCSKKLGANYLDGGLPEWHKSDLENRCYTNLTDGKKGAMPRYYSDKLYTKEEKERIVNNQINRMAARIIKSDPFNARNIHNTREYKKAAVEHLLKPDSKNKI